MKKFIFVAYALVALCSPIAHAATTTYTDVANHYSVTFDTDLWGDNAAMANSKLSIFNLYDAAITGQARGWKSSGYSDWLLNGVTFTALSGYTFSSITAGITGNYALNDADGLAGSSSAWTQNTFGWITNDPSDSDFINLNYLYCDGCTSTPDFKNVWGTAGSFDVSLKRVFAANTSIATFSNVMSGGVYAFGTGSSARLAQTSTYFDVVMVPVPEPETYAMLLAGLGLMGAIARRRKSKETA